MLAPSRVFWVSCACHRLPGHPTPLVWELEIYKVKSWEIRPGGPLGYWGEGKNSSSPVPTHEHPPGTGQGGPRHGTPKTLPSSNPPVCPVAKNWGTKWVGWCFPPRPSGLGFSTVSQQCWEHQGLVWGALRGWHPRKSVPRVSPHCPRAVHRVSLESHRHSPAPSFPRAAPRDTG